MTIDTLVNLLYTVAGLVALIAIGWMIGTLVADCLGRGERQDDELARLRRENEKLRKDLERLHAADLDREHRKLMRSLKRTERLLSD